MKIKKLEINNFRGFGQAKVEFPKSNLAVFIGVNGQGKSSILDLVAMFLNPFTQLLSGKPHQILDYLITTQDINISTQDSANQISLVTAEDTNIKIANSATQYGATAFHPSDLFHKYVNETLAKVQALDNKVNIPVLTYYRANRFFNTHDENEKVEPIYKRPQLAAFENAFSKITIDFNDFVHWFRNEEDKENEIIKKERNFDIANPNLQPVRVAITAFFSKLNDSGFNNLHVERGLPNNQNFDSARFPSSLVISKNGLDFRLEQLSDGEKMLLMVVCDIARRLSIANPGLENPLDGHGIVLIDEIELHLHPKWQREVIPALMATFPNIQFIVSTHSPQVLSRVDQKDIFLLKDGEVMTLSSNPKGLDTNAILEEVMDTPKYPREVDNLVEELFSLIQQRKFDQAITIRGKIAEESPDNPVLQRADAMVERLKILN